MMENTSLPIDMRKESLKNFISKIDHSLATEMMLIMGIDRKSKKFALRNSS
jgi:hypothetical protein